MKLDRINSLVATLALAILTLVTVSPPVRAQAVDLVSVATAARPSPPLDVARLGSVYPDALPSPANVCAATPRISRPANVAAVRDSDRYPTWVKALYWTSQGAVLATGVSDVATTYKAVELGDEEGNPVLRKRDGTPSYALKATLVATSSVGSHALLYERGHPLLAAAVNLGVSGIQAWAAVHNFTNVNRLLAEPPRVTPAAAVRLRF
jgi:hypothetical protein